MKKLIILPTIALLMTLGVFALGSQSKSAHAAQTTNVQSGIAQQSESPSTSLGEKPEANKNASEAKGAELDGPGGHQDQNGVNINHDFQGNE